MSLFLEPEPQTYLGYMAVVWPSCAKLEPQNAADIPGSTMIGPGAGLPISMTCTWPPCGHLLRHPRVSGVVILCKLDDLVQC